jgi:hypothetical protein
MASALLALMVGRSLSSFESPLPSGTLLVGNANPELHDQVVIAANNSADQFETTFLVISDRA